MTATRRAPDPAPPYYSPDTLELEGTDVWLCLGGLWGHGRLARKHGRRHFYMRHHSGKYLPFPKKTAPLAWRPIEPAAWPDLPKPLRDDLVWEKPYSLAGTITTDEVAVRVGRALRGARMVTVWDGPPWRRTDADRIDELRATQWFKALDVQDQGLVRGRAAVPPYTWRALGEHLGLSEQTARKRYEAALQKLCAIANASASAVG